MTNSKTSVHENFSDYHLEIGFFEKVFKTPQSFNIRLFSIFRCSFAHFRRFMPKYSTKKRNQISLKKIQKTSVKNNKKPKKKLNKIKTLVKNNKNDLYSHFKNI